MELKTKHPRSVNLYYLKLLKATNDKYYEKFITDAEKVLKPNQRIYAIADDKDALLSNIWRIIENAGTLLSDEYINKLASAFVNKLIKFEADNGVASKIIQIDPKSLISQFNLEDAIAKSIVENVDLIKTIPKRLFADVEKAIAEEFTQGTGYKNLITRLNQIKNQQVWKLERIARTETAKLNTTINVAQAKQLGQRTFIWLTAGDERTCPICAPRDGKEYTFNDLLPGHSHPNCKCQMKFKL